MGRFAAPRGVAWWSCLALAASACGSASSSVAKPIGDAHTTASPIGGGSPQGRDTPSDDVSVVVAEDVRRACELPDEPAEAPRFDFDSARLRPRGEDILVGIASCVVGGKLGDSTLEIVGHTDPRGSPDYNQQLGFYRAVAAKQALESMGVPGAMLGVRSRGERDATGANEASWALDRRVEIHRGAARNGREWGTSTQSEGK